MPSGSSISHFNTIMFEVRALPILILHEKWRKNRHFFSVVENLAFSRNSAFLSHSLLADSKWQNLRLIAIYRFCSTKFLWAVWYSKDELVDLVNRGKHKSGKEFQVKDILKATFIRGWFLFVHDYLCKHICFAVVFVETFLRKSRFCVPSVCCI